VLDPGVVRVADRRVAERPAAVAAEQDTGPVADVERRVGEGQAIEAASPTLSGMRIMRPAGTECTLQGSNLEPSVP
jgi:hypothetical protein